MAKKFFYDRVHNTKRTIINWIIIGVCIIGVIVCFIIVSNFQGNSDENQNGKLSIKEEVTIEVNDELKKEMYFSKIENVDLNSIEIKYPLNFDVAKVGEYTITVVVNNTNYNTLLKVVDTVMPELTTKDVTIQEGESYTSNDFVDKCNDNSKEECKIDFYKESKDEDGKAIDYSKYTKAGTYTIKITANDSSQNQNIKEAKLIIKSKDGSSNDDRPVTPVTCKYGDAKYDEEAYLLAVDVSNNGCALSLDLYKDETVIADIMKLRDSETTRIKKDVDALNIKGVPSLNRKVTAILNTNGTGLVGYELEITVSIENNGKTEKVVEYKVNNSGKRVFTSNPYKLSA